MKKNIGKTRLLLAGLMIPAMLAAAIINPPVGSAQKDQPNAPQAAFTVTTVADSGAGSLRQAILDANATSGTDTISFAIAGVGPFTISPASELPAITEAVTIDGYTQTGAAANTSCNGTATIQIVINGTNTGAGSNGLTLSAGISTIRGLVINGFDGNGIEIRSGGAPTGNVIAGNFIGTNAAGTASVPNGANGIIAAVGANNIIGGTDAASRNVISGNAGDGIAVSSTASSTVINGNLIGTNAAGTVDLGNNSDGVDISNSPDNRVGGSPATLGCAPGNVISGNNEDGVNISGSSTGNFVRGNLIGTDITGSLDLGNTAQGVYVFASGNGIGGGSAAARNIISGNDGGGVNIGGGANNAVEGNYIGTNLGGTTIIRNAEGVRLDGGANNNKVGIGATEMPFYATNNSNQLVRFNEAGTFQTVGAITGLQTNEVIEGLDIRPLNGQLYALGVVGGTTGRIYRINKQTAAATQVGTGSIALTGTSFGFDFNPTVDRIRLVTSGGQNLRLNPNNAAVTVDGNLNGATTAASSAAYTNSFAGSTTTTLYDINAATDMLYIQSNPNAGTTTAVGSLGIDVTEIGGFDIRASDNRAFATLTVGSFSGLYSINLTTGIVSLVSSLGNNQVLRTFTTEVSTPAQTNILSGNDVGVDIVEGFSNVVRGNLIGTNAGGTDLGNTEAGVYIQQPTAMNNVIGGTGASEGNTIRFNGNGTTAQPLFGEGGVVVFAGATGNRILGNGIDDNTGLGIDLGQTGPNAVTANDALDVDSGDGNNYQNFPALSSAVTNTAGTTTTVVGTLMSAASKVYRVEFFAVATGDASGNGEGAFYRGATNVTTDATGMASFTYNLTAPVSAGQSITATATDNATGDTSEFSAVRVVTGAAASAGRESDVQPRPNGDGVVDADDIQEIRRFSVGLDLPYQSNEFQRADASPRSSSGDGFLDADDVQQARRYSVGTDTNQAAAGPSSPMRFTTESYSSKSLIEQLIGTEDSQTDALSQIVKERALRVDGSNALVSGRTVTVPVLANATGDEAGYTFTLLYNSAVLSKPIVTIGAAGGDLVVNTTRSGQIGISLTSFGGGKIAAGSNQLLLNVKFTFEPNAKARITPIAFSSLLARQKVAGVDPNRPLAQPTFTDGEIVLSANGKSLR